MAKPGSTENAPAPELGGAKKPGEVVADKKTRIPYSKSRKQKD
jgi:hypothetical protein